MIPRTVLLGAAAILGVAALGYYVVAVVPPKLALLVFGVPVVLVGLRYALYRGVLGVAWVLGRMEERRARDD